MKTSVIVLGGGYGGLACLRGLSGLDRNRYEVTLIDHATHHAIKTRFHERAVSPFREPGTRYPLALLAGASGTQFICDEAMGVDFARKVVVGKRGERPYDYLVVALGARSAYFGIPGAELFAHHLQDYRAVVRAAKAVKKLNLGQQSQTIHQVVVCGAGIEGMEVAAQIRQLAPPTRLSVTVVERSEKILEKSAVSNAARDYAQKKMEQNGIRFFLGRSVERVEVDSMVLDGGEKIDADLMFWCSGQQRVALKGLQEDKPFVTTETLQHPEHPEVFGVGDFAWVEGGDKFANMVSAQRAVYQGGLVAENLIRLEKGEALSNAQYRPKGEMVALGDYDGVGRVGSWSVVGKPAALAKKTNELRYLSMLLRDLPRPILRLLTSPFHSLERGKIRKNS